MRSCLEDGWEERWVEVCEWEVVSSWGLDWTFGVTGEWFERNHCKDGRENVSIHYLSWGWVRELHQRSKRREVKIIRDAWLWLIIIPIDVQTWEGLIQ